jgi:hypothetical protein
LQSNNKKEDKTMTSLGSSLSFVEYGKKNDDEPSSLSSFGVFSLVLYKTQQHILHHHLL